MIFIPNKLYIISPYTIPFTIPYTITRLSEFLHFQKTSLSMVFLMGTKKKKKKD